MIGQRLFLAKVECSYLLPPAGDKELGRVHISCICVNAIPQFSKTERQYKDISLHTELVS
jgi:hypothetical protein